MAKGTYDFTAKTLDDAAWTALMLENAGRSLNAWTEHRKDLGLPLYPGEAFRAGYMQAARRYGRHADA